MRLEADQSLAAHAAVLNCLVQRTGRLALVSLKLSGKSLAVAATDDAMWPKWRSR